MHQLRDLLPDAFIAVLEAAWARDGLTPGEPWPPAGGSLQFERVPEGDPARPGAAAGREAS